MPGGKPATGAVTLWWVLSRPAGLCPGGRSLHRLGGTVTGISHQSHVPVGTETPLGNPTTWKADLPLSVTHLSLGTLERGAPGRTGAPSRG